MPALIVFFFSFLVQLSEGSSNKAILFGGGCDPHTPSEVNPSYPVMNQMKNALNGRSWEVDTVFGDKASKESLLESLDKIISDQQTGRSTSQLYLSFVTHGLPGNEKTSHGVCVWNPKSRSSEYLPVTDPSLHERLQKLKSLGVKLAISDGSCYSGESIKAFEKYGCVTTSQASDYVAYGDGIHSGVMLLPSGQNPPLSAVDLWERSLFSSQEAQKGYPNFPQLSTLGEDLHQSNLFLGVLAAGDPDMVLNKQSELNCVPQDQTFTQLDELQKQMHAIAEVASNDEDLRSLEGLTGEKPEASMNEVVLRLADSMRNYRQLYLSMEQTRGKVDTLKDEILRIQVPIDGNVLYQDATSPEKILQRTEDLRSVFRMGRTLSKYEEDSRAKLPGRISLSGMDLHQMQLSLAFAKEKGIPLSDGIVSIDSEASVSIARGAEQILAGVPKETKDRLERLLEERSAAIFQQNYNLLTVNAPTTLNGSGDVLPEWKLKSSIARDVNRLRFYKSRQRRRMGATGPCADFKF